MNAPEFTEKEAGPPTEPVYGVPRLQSVAKHLRCAEVIQEANFRVAYDNANLETLFGKQLQDITIGHGDLFWLFPLNKQVMMNWKETNFKGYLSSVSPVMVDGEINNASMEITITPKEN